MTEKKKREEWGFWFPPLTPYHTCFGVGNNLQEAWKGVQRLDYCEAPIARGWRCRRRYFQTREGTVGSSLFFPESRQAALDWLSLYPGGGPWWWGTSEDGETVLLEEDKKRYSLTTGKCLDKENG